MRVMFKGKILQLATVTVVPFEQLQNGQWTCVVVASKNPAYAVGGYNLTVHCNELSAGRELTVAAKKD